jgi:thiamine pyrophosphate-dependent acetolactate synthase large subunit-like protein
MGKKEGSMNAYELADEILDCNEPDFNLVKDAANMLRQQADRIAELENKSKPVAWMEYIQDEEWEVWYTEPTDLPEGHSYKPLYLAPQTKPLSDEEIIKIFNQIWNDGGNTNGVMHRFARAIQERHGIK